MHSEAGDQFKPCDVVNALQGALTTPKLKIAMKIMTRQTGEFTRKDILSKPEEGDTVAAQDYRYRDVLNFMQTSQVLADLISATGMRGCGRYYFDADGVTPACEALKNGATLGELKKKTPKTGDKTTSGTERKTESANDLGKAKSAVLDLLTKSSDYLEFVWDTGQSSQNAHSFSRIN